MTTKLNNKKTAGVNLSQKAGFDLIFSNYCYYARVRELENARADKQDSRAVPCRVKNEEVANYINNNQLSLINLFKNYTISSNYAFVHATSGKGKTYEAIHKTPKGEKRIFVNNFTITGLFVDGVFYRSNYKYGTKTAQSMTIYCRDNLHLRPSDTKHVKYVCNEELFDLLLKHKVIKAGAYNYDFSFLKPRFPNYEDMLTLKAKGA